MPDWLEEARVRREILSRIGYVQSSFAYHILICISVRRTEEASRPFPTVRKLELPATQVCRLGNRLVEGTVRCLAYSIRLPAKRLQSSLRL
jgi:hypothetical protein